MPTDQSSVTFTVDDVEPATTPLATCKTREAVEHLLNTSESKFLPDRPIATQSRVEACWNFMLDCVAEIRHHPLIAAAHHAYAEHRPLVLSPDVIWVTIAQGLAQHIRLDPEKYRHLLVKHEGKRQLKIERDDMHRRSPENPWASVVDDLVNQLSSDVGESAEQFACDFSTTGPVERTVSRIVLLDIFQPYYSYLLIAGCGIPSITLEGTADDWRRLREKVELLAPFDLDWWLKHLRPICDQFVAAAEGRVVREHWLRIYKVRWLYLAEAIHGWLAKLFPYTRNFDTNQYSIRNVLFDPKVEAEIEQIEATHPKRSHQFGDHVPGVNPEALPKGVSQVPFTLEWRDMDRKVAMEMAAGPLVVTQDPLTLALRPILGWAVREAPPIEQAMLQLEKHTVERETSPNVSAVYTQKGMFHLPTDAGRFYENVRQAWLHGSGPSALYKILPFSDWEKPKWVRGERYHFASTSNGEEILIETICPHESEWGSIFVGRRNGEPTQETGQKIAKSFTDFLVRALASGEQPYFRKSGFVPLS
jgi:hypothetical protein